MDARTRTRLAAVSALVVSFAATVLIGAGAVGAGGSAPVDTALRPLAAADLRLSQTLRALEPGGSTRAAVAATRDAVRAGERAIAILQDSGDRTGRRALAAVRLRQGLVDAVGSTLANPASPLRDELTDRSRATVTAFVELGLEGVGGAGRLPAAELVAFSRRRAAR